MVAPGCGDVLYVLCERHAFCIPICRYLTVIVLIDSTSLRLGHFGTSTAARFLILLSLALCGLVSSRAVAQQKPGTAKRGFRHRPEPVSPTPCKPAITPIPNGLQVWSPGGKRYIVNKQDAGGIYQIYVGAGRAQELTCISCAPHPNSPGVTKHKLQPHWYPSGDWIVLAGEMDNFQPPIFSTPSMILGWLQSGLWVNIFVTRPDGSEWHQLSDFGDGKAADGFTGVDFTPDGKQAVWAQIVSGNIFQYLFGKWQLILADFQEAASGVPSFTNLRDITPAGAAWVEPGNFAPDGKSLLITADIGLSDPQGMDQFILDITTGSVHNLTNSPTVWDEHGVFSPDGHKIFFMSSWPLQGNAELG